MHAQSYILWAGPSRPEAAMTLCSRRTPLDRATKANEAVTCRACRQVVDREEAARRAGKTQMGQRDMTHNERRARAETQVADLKERLRRARLQRRDRLRLGLTVGHDVESRIRELEQELAEWRMMQSG